MAKRIEFFPSNFEEIKEFIDKNRKKIVFNFFNSHSVYIFAHNRAFGNFLSEKTINKANFIDGFIVSLVLSLREFKKMKRLQGPKFTDLFLRDKSLKGRHFFIGFENKDLKFISEKYGLDPKMISGYNPVYIKDEKFPEEEIEKISGFINKHKADYVWIGVGSPKQELLSSDLYSRISSRYLFNIGAALDFVSEKKKRAPKIFQSLGIEWLYRLFTDFSHSRKKVRMSLIGSIYALSRIKMKNEKSAFP